MTVTASQDLCLLTRKGREEVRRLLGKEKDSEWLLCEEGLLDAHEGVPVSDAAALQILIDKVESTTIQKMSQ